MAQQTIDNGESGLHVRTALNEMFGELYGAIGPFQPIVLPNVDANYTQPIVEGVFITNIFIIPVSGSITLNIGTTPNGGEILPDLAIGSFTPISAQEYFGTSGNLYFTLTGTGIININIYYIGNIL